MNLLEQKRVWKRDEENRCVLNIGTPQTCLYTEISSEMANGCYRGVSTNVKQKGLISSILMLPKGMISKGIFSRAPQLYRKNLS